MFKLKNQFKIIYLFSITFISLLFIFNNKVMAMDDLVNEITEENEIIQENEEDIISIQKFCSLHEMGHALVAYDLSQIDSGNDLINLKTIELKVNNKEIQKDGVILKELIEGGVDFSFDRSQFGYLFSLNVSLGGPEAEKRIKMPIEELKYKGHDDEKDIQDIIEYIIQRDWFSEYYSKTNNIEETKQNIRNFAQEKTEQIIDKYERFLSPLADELLEKK
ncbi:SVM family protein [New Jersey aster yellows phytoplasma]|nr:SVM family protein [New Jersey aster yellows phytoplasma]